MGLSEEATLSCVRLSLGRFTTREEVERAAALIVEAARKLEASTAVGTGRT
jgi:cysteine sulfinate desulfinase/cysteine desulfurase-like protein